MTLNSHLVKAVQVQLKLKLSSTWTQLEFDLSSNSSIMNDSVVICTKYLVSVYPPVIHPICFEASPLPWRFRLELAGRDVPSCRFCLGVKTVVASAVSSKPVLPFCGNRRNSGGRHRRCRRLNEVLQLLQKNRLFCIIGHERRDETRRICRLSAA